VIAAVGKVYEWEIVKLLAQKRTYLGLISAILVPIVFVVVLVLQTGGPNDVPLGRYIRDTGLAAPFVVLFFMSIWGLPLITALVAGDIVASESQNGTLKTILTRSRLIVVAGVVAPGFTSRKDRRRSRSGKRGTAQSPDLGCLPRCRGDSAEIESASSKKPALRLRP